MSSPFAALLGMLGSVEGVEALEGEDGGFDLSSLGVGDDAEALAGAEGVVIPPALAQLFHAYGIDLTGDVGAAVADALAANGEAVASGGEAAPKTAAGAPGVDAPAPQVSNVAGDGVASSNGQSADKAANATPAAVAQPVVPGIDVTANGGVVAEKPAVQAAGVQAPVAPVVKPDVQGAEMIVLPAEGAGKAAPSNLETKSSVPTGVAEQPVVADPEAVVDNKPEAAVVAKTVAESKPRRFQTELPEEVRAPALRNAATVDPAVPAQKPAGSEALSLEQRILLTSEHAAKAAGQDTDQVNQAKNASVPPVANEKASPVAKQIAAAFTEAGGEDVDVVVPQVKADVASGKDAAVASQPQAAAKAVAENVQANSAAAAAAPQPKGQVAAQTDEPAAGASVLEYDEDAVDPGEVVPATGKSKAQTANASTDESGPAPAGAARAAVADGRNMATAAAEAASTGGAADIDGEPDGDLSLTLNLRTTGQVGAQAAAQTQGLQQAPSQAQSGHVAMQVAAAIERNLQNGNTRFQMRFDPPELGRVDVHLKVGKDGKVQAHLVVDRPETLDLFMRDQRGLERALQSAGLQPDGDNLTFSLNDQGDQQSAFSQGEQQHPQGGQAETPTPFDIAEIIDSQAQQTALRNQRGGLDIRI